MKSRNLLALFGLAALLTLAACKCPCAGGGKGSAASVDLFNGKDLSGWKSVLAEASVKPETVWSVKDGLIVCKGEPVGFLYTDREFSNFRLVVEYRWAPGAKPGNSGIFTRLNRPSPSIPRTVETQLMHGNAGDVLTLQGMKMAADQPRFFSIKNHELAGDICGVKKLQDQEKPPGEWNRVEILAQGPKYTVWMNGKKVNEAGGIELLPGAVGLQSEGGEIHFRRVTIAPLP